MDHFDFLLYWSTVIYISKKNIFSRKNRNHAYKDIFKHVIGTTLTLQREPEMQKIRMLLLL